MDYQKIYNNLVLDLQTGIYYDSLKEASENSKYHYLTLGRMLNGKIKNKTNMCFV